LRSSMRYLSREITGYLRVAPVPVRVLSSACIQVDSFGLSDRY